MVEMNFTHPANRTRTGEHKDGLQASHSLLLKLGEKEWELSTSGVQPCANKGNMGLMVGDHCVLGLSKLCFT